MIASQKAGSAATDEGYWAVEMWPADSRLERPRFVCHARDDGSARDMAARLMGAARDINGFTYYRLQPPAASYANGSLPNMDCSLQVANAAWTQMGGRPRAAA